LLVAGRPLIPCPLPTTHTHVCASRTEQLYVLVQLGSLRGVNETEEVVDPSPRGKLAS